MVCNFTVVKELRHHNSYAARLYAYMYQINLMEWSIQRLQSNPFTKSATITTLEPLTDEGYSLCQYAGFSKKRRRSGQECILHSFGFWMIGVCEFDYVMDNSAGTVTKSSLTERYNDNYCEIGTLYKR